DPRRRWRPGQSLDGARVIIHSDQGLGDAVMFARFLPEIKRRWPGCTLILHCQKGLAPLLRASNLGIDEFVTTEITEMSEAPPHDVNAMLGSLPYLFGLDAIPAWTGPYLSSPKADLGPRGAARKIGICHAGDPAHLEDRSRSCPLRLFRPIHDLPG